VCIVPRIRNCIFIMISLTSCREQDRWQNLAQSNCDVSVRNERDQIYESLRCPGLDSTDQSFTLISLRSRTSLLHQSVHRPVTVSFANRSTCFNQSLSPVGQPVLHQSLFSDPSRSPIGPSVPFTSGSTGPSSVFVLRPISFASQSTGFYQSLFTAFTHRSSVIRVLTCPGVG
jgi:hypothetical protein